MLHIPSEQNREYSSQSGKKTAKRLVQKVMVVQSDPTANKLFMNHIFLRLLQSITHILKVNI
jgi:hypothetical protein